MGDEIGKFLIFKRKVPLSLHEFVYEYFFFVCVFHSRESMENVMEKLMGSQYDFDLTYITERIISVLYLSDLEEQHYSANLKEVAAMLKSKHQDKFLVSCIVV